MKTTLNYQRVPRVLVRMSEKERELLTHKEITTASGEKIKLCTRWIDPEDDEARYELALKVGTVIGVSPGVTEIQEGDIALLDYVVDSDISFEVCRDGGDKIVSVPCRTTIHQDSKYVTTYDKKFLEKNVAVYKKGDIDQLSLILGVIREDRLIPNDHYVFCEFRASRSEEMIKLESGLYAYKVYDDTFLSRKVLFCGDAAECCPGEIILATINSNVEITIMDRKFDVIPISDIHAVINEFPVI